LEQEEVTYAISGVMAMFFHGCRRFTESVEFLVSEQDRMRILHSLDSHGFVATEFPRNVRDSATGVRVQLFISDEPAGNAGRWQVTFPPPAEACARCNGLYVLQVHSLVEQLLAVGLSQGAYSQSLADVQRLVETVKLPATLSDQIDPSVRDEYLRIWARVRDNPMSAE
jgi:hypothetical protein